MKNSEVIRLLRSLKRGRLVFLDVHLADTVLTVRADIDELATALEMEPSDVELIEPDFVSPGQKDALIFLKNAKPAPPTSCQPTHEAFTAGWNAHKAGFEAEPDGYGRALDAYEHDPHGFIRNPKI